MSVQLAEAPTSTTQLHGVTGAYSLVFGSLLLTSGSLADRFDCRRVLQIGLAGFGLISALVLAVHSADELIAVRAPLGVAASCMAPVTMSLVLRLFDDSALRMRAMTAMTAMVVIGMSAMALGPVAGGAVLGSFSWRVLVLVNTPIALIAGYGCSTLTDSRTTEEH